jgi:hypothetical protein
MDIRNKCTLFEYTFPLLLPLNWRAAYKLIWGLLVVAKWISVSQSVNVSGLLFHDKFLEVTLVVFRAVNNKTEIALLHVPQVWLPL